MKSVRVKTKYRAEWWVEGRKHVRVFGGRGQAARWLRENEPRATSIDIRPFQERSEPGVNYEQETQP